MAKKNNKTPNPLSVAVKPRYLHGIVFVVIAFLTLMLKTLAIRLVRILFIAAGMDNMPIRTLVDCSNQDRSHRHEVFLPLKHTGMDWTLLRHE